MKTLKPSAKLLIVFLTALLFLFSCISNKQPEVTYHIENPDSQLTQKLIQENIFNKSTWKLDYIEVMQSNGAEDSEIEETATFWVTTRYIPTNQFFKISHNLLTYQASSSIETEKLFIFKSDAGITDIQQKISGIDDAKCAEYKNSDFQDCIFIGRYGQTVSILTISMPKDVKISDALVITSFLFEATNKNLSP